MSKVTSKPGTVLFPVPTVLVSSVAEGKKPNLITIAWTGIMSSEPPTMYIGVRPGRHSHELIGQSGEYVINIPGAEQVKAVDYCGTVSGKNVDKFAATGLTPVPATRVQAPLVAECPVNIECKVTQTLNIGTHTVFVAEVLAVNYSAEILDEKGRPNLDKIRPYGFCNNEYRLMGEKLGHYGYSAKG